MELMIQNVFTRYKFRDDEDEIKYKILNLMTHDGVRFIKVPMIPGDYRKGREMKTKAQEFTYRLYNTEHSIIPTGFFYPIMRLLRDEFQYEVIPSGLITKDLLNEKQQMAYTTGKCCIIKNGINRPTPKPLHEDGLIGARFVINYFAELKNITFKKADRPEVAEALKTALEKKRGTIKLPTGVGKTGFGAMLAAELGMDFLYMAPNKTLFAQTYEAFAIGEEDDGGIFGKELVGRIGDRYFETDKLITIATPRKLLNAIEKRDKDTLEFCQRIKAVYVDEWHHVAPRAVKKNGKIVIEGNQWYTILQWLQNAYYRIGVSGTPQSPDGLATKFGIGATGDEIYNLSFKEAAEANYIMMPKVLWFENVPTIEHFSRPKDFHTVYTEGILENGIRNQLILKTANYFVEKDKSVLIVVDRVELHLKPLMENAEYLKEELSPKFKIAHLMGDDKIEVRTETFDKLRKKEITVLITTLAKEGVDIPSLDVVIMAAGQKSSVAVLQKAGRVVRINEGKEPPIIVDFQDGRFEETNCAYLVDHSRRRKALYEKEEFPVQFISRETWQALLNGKEVTLIKE